MADYQILVNAILNAANLQQQITNLQGTINSGAGGNKGINLINTAATTQAIQEVTNKVRTAMRDVASISSVKLFQDPAGANTGALVNYVNNMGLARTATLEFKNGWNILQGTMKQDFLAQQKLQENQMRLTDRYTSSLANMRQENQQAFKTPAVQQAATNLQNLIKTQDGGIKSTKDLTVAQGKLQDAIYSANARATTGIRGWMNEMSIAISRTITWGISMGIIYGTMRKLNEATQYIKDLNKAMTNIQMINDMTKEQIRGLAQDYNNIAKEMGATTIQVAEGK